MLKQPWHLTSCTHGKQTTEQRQLDPVPSQKTQERSTAHRSQAICTAPSRRKREKGINAYHEEGVGGLDEALLLVLELLQLRRRVQQVDVILEYLQRRRHKNDTDQNPEPNEKCTEPEGFRRIGPPCVPWWQARVRSGVSALVGLWRGGSSEKKSGGGGGRL